MKDPNRDLFDIAYINRNRRDRVRDGIFIGSVVASFVSSILNKVVYVYPNAHERFDKVTPRISPLDE